MPIELPPLRERYGDAQLLASYFVDAYNREFKKRMRGLTPASTKLVDQYHWPGNIRELRNTIERAMLLATHDWLEPVDFTGLAHPVTASAFRLPADGVRLEDLERQLVMQALERTGGNQSKAAALLGLHRDQVRYRVEKFGLQPA
jgi:transcriptional regulator with PAS, ATPase and Fis domain